MCRYGFKNYKSHYVCFECRKSFKQPIVIDLLKRDGKYLRYLELQRPGLTPDLQDEFNDIEEKYFKGETKCPHCGSFMANLGRDFKAPPRKDLKKWAIIRSLYTLGHTFHTCGCTGPGFIPKSKKQHLDYLNDMLCIYKFRLEETQKKDISKYENKNEQLSYWSDLINKITEEIKLVSFL